MMQASALEKTRVPWETSLIWCCNRPSCTFMIKYSENENDIKQAKEKKKKTWVPVVVARYCNTIIRCKSHEWVTCCQNQSFYYHFIKYFLFHFQANILNIISYNLDLKVKTNCFETVTASLTRFGFFFKEKRKNWWQYSIRQVMCRIWILKRKISCKKQLVNDGYEVWRKRFVVSKKLTFSLGHLLRLSKPLNTQRQRE